MQYRSIFKVLGILIGIVGLAEIIPMFYSMASGYRDFWGFLYSVAVSTTVGFLLFLIPKSDQAFKSRDGFALVSFAWLAAGFFGALPYYFSGAAPSFTDAYFETASGFTTTGSSIMTNIEALSPEILLWRSMTQWFGGMGIVVLTLAIVPYLDIGGMSIFQAEVPGPTADKLTPRIQDTAKVLWLIYVFFTGLLVVLLWYFGMTWFDAINHSMTTMSTGGFGTKNNSIAFYPSAAIQWTLVIFMLIGGVNFALHYHIIFEKLNFKPLLQDSEFKFYILVVFLSIGSIVTILWWKQGIQAWEPAIRDVAFTVSTIVTTTGFATADFELWPIYSHFVLILLMVMGGCAGSTAGGVKSVRMLLVLKYMYGEIVKLIHPNMIRTVKLGKNFVHRDIVAGILSFMFIYATATVVSILLVSIETEDMITAFTAVIACISNVGPGLGMVGPTDNFAHLGDFTTWVLSIDMIMGRLELLTMIVLCFPQTWKR